MIDPRKQIKEASVALRAIMEEGLSSIADAYVERIASKFNRATPSQEMKVISDLEPMGVTEYKARLRTAYAVIAREALDLAKKEIPSLKKTKFAEDLDSVKLDEFDRLPPSVRKRVQVLANLTADTQIADLKKNVSFQYAASVGSTDSTDLVRADLQEAAADYVGGSAISSGAITQAAQIINSARADFLFQDEVVEAVDAFEFVNGDPVSPVCENLAGTIFLADDPEAFRYFPPLHWNCKSYLRAILKGRLGDRKIGKLAPTNAKAAASVQFSEQMPHRDEALLRFNFSLSKLAEFPPETDSWLSKLYGGC